MMSKIKLLLFNHCDADYLYVFHSFPFFLPLAFSSLVVIMLFSIRMENSVDPVQLTSQYPQKPVDLDLQCFPKRINQNSAGHR